MKPVDMKPMLSKGNFGEACGLSSLGELGTQLEDLFWTLYLTRSAFAPVRNYFLELV